MHYYFNGFKNCEEWMKRWILWVGIFSVSASVAYSQVTLLGHIDQKHGTSGDGISYAGCWGYTAPDGREYALLGTYTGCAVIDITNGASPVEIGHIPGASSLWKEVKSYDRYAYVVADVNGSQGLQIINLGNLPTSVSLDTTILSLGGFSILQSHTISIHDGYLYLNGTGSGLLIASLANPRRPQYLGRWNTRYAHDSYVRKDTIFAAAINQGRLDIINATNKSAPALIASIAYTGGGTHNVWTTKDRKYAVTTDEIGSTAKNLKIWNLQNLPTVSTTPVATFSPNPSDIVHNVFIRGDYAYVAWYTAGFRVVNLTNPVTPLDAGGYDTSTEPPGNYDGMWACYPFFPSGKIIGSDMQNGLYVFNFAGLSPRRNTGLLEPSNGETFRSPASARFRWQRAADLDKDPHYYLVRITGSGLDTTIRSNDSTFVFGNGARFSPGTTYTWNVTTKDEFNTTRSQQSYTFTVTNSPVVYSSFTAAFIGNGRVQLNWRTLSENQNLGFDIQRSYSTPTHFLTVPNRFVPGFGTTTTPHDYAFRDSNVIPAGVWYYRLRQMSQDSSMTFSDPVMVDVLTAVRDQKILAAYALEQNYPNPFNPSTRIEFSLKSSALTTLAIFNLLGQEVARVVDGVLPSGRHSAEFNASAVSLPTVT